MRPTSYAETARESYRIAALQTREERAAALEAIDPAFRDLVRQTATNVRAVALHWRKRIAAGQSLASVPERVQATLSDLFPQEFPRT
jgi:hypothetical protein